MLHITSQLLNEHNVKHAFFTRQGGVSGGEFSSLNCSIKSNDDRLNIERNLQVVADFFSVSTNELQLCKQAHGANVLITNYGRDVRDLQQHEADAIVSTNHDIFIGVQTADCTPILLYDCKHKIKAAIHASWRTTSRHIITNCLQIWQQQGGNLSSTIAAIGPAIQMHSYEVGEEVLTEFLKLDHANIRHFKKIPHKSSNKYLFDLPGYCEFFLRTNGLKAVDNLCVDTYSDAEKFFSFRRATHANQRAGIAEPARVGCQLSVI